jgi:hypothetical protein
MLHKNNRWGMLAIVCIAIMAFLVAGTMTSCEGPEGPAGTTGATGPQGPAGNDGQDGEDGEDGEDGTDITEAACLECHNNDVLIAKRFELNTHAHATMPYSLSRGGREGCGRCHSHQNFLNYINTGSDETLDTVTGLTCKSCHTLHNSDEVDDFSYGLVADGEVTYLTGETHSFGAGNPSNLCINCHQPRRNWGAYDTTPENGSDEVTITSGHAGPHYGIAGSIVFGEGGDDRNGRALNQGVFGPHSSMGCVDCHMGSDSNHEFYPVVANCTGCHTSATNFDINGAATEMHEAVHAIEMELVRLGWFEENEDGTISSLASTSNPLVMTGQQYTAFWNFVVIEEGAGWEYHNPPYMRALINNIEENLGLPVTSW